MMLDFDQMKHLESVGEMRFRFVDNGNATKKEKQDLRDLDEYYFQVFQFHIITNIEEVR